MPDIGAISAGISSIKTAIDIADRTSKTSKDTHPLGNS